MHNPNQVLSASDPIRVKSFGVTAAATTLTMWITTGCNMALSYYMQKRKWTMQRLNGSGCIEISLAPKSSRCSHSYCQDEYRRLVDRVSLWKDGTINRHFVELHFVTSLLVRFLPIYFRFKTSIYHTQERTSHPQISLRFLIRETILCKLHLLLLSRIGEDISSRNARFNVTSYPC